MRSGEESDAMGEGTFFKWDPIDEREVDDERIPSGRGHQFMDVSSGVSTESDDGVLLSARSHDTANRNVLLKVKSRLEHLVAHVSGPSRVVERCNDKDPYFSLISDESTAFAKRKHAAASAAKPVAAVVALLTDGAAYLNRICDDGDRGDASAATSVAGIAPLTHLEQLALCDSIAPFPEATAVPNIHVRGPRPSALSQSLEFARPTAVTSLFILHMFEALLRKDVQHQERDESFTLLLRYHYESVRELRRNREAAAVRLERFAHLAEEATHAVTAKFSAVVTDLEARHRAAIEERRGSDWETFSAHCHASWERLRRGAAATAALSELVRAEDCARSILVAEFTSALVQFVSRMEESRWLVNQRAHHPHRSVDWQQPIDLEHTLPNEVAAHISARMQALQVRLARSIVLEPVLLEVVDDAGAVPQSRARAAVTIPRASAIVENHPHGKAMPTAPSAAATVRASSSRHAQARSGLPHEKVRSSQSERRTAPEATRRNRSAEGARFTASASSADVPEAPRELNQDVDGSAASSAHRRRSPGRPFADLLNEALHRNLARASSPEGGSPGAAAIGTATSGAASSSSERDPNEVETIPWPQASQPPTAPARPRAKHLDGTTRAPKATAKHPPCSKAKTQPLSTAAPRETGSDVSAVQRESGDKRRPVGQHMSVEGDGGGGTPEPSVFRTDGRLKAREATLAVPSPTVKPAGLRVAAAAPKLSSSGAVHPRLTAPSFVVEKDERSDLLDTEGVLPRWQAATVGESALRSEVTQMFLRVRETMSHLYRERPETSSSPHGWLLRGSCSNAGAPSCERRFVMLTSSGGFCVCVAEDPFRPRRKKEDTNTATTGPSVEWQTLFHLEDVVRVEEEKERDGGGGSTTTISNSNRGGGAFAFGFHVDVAVHLGPALEDVGCKRFRFWAFSKRDRATWIHAVQEGVACARKWELDGLVEVAPLMRMLSAVKPHLLSTARDHSDGAHASPDHRRSLPGRKSL